MGRAKKIEWTDDEIDDAFFSLAQVMVVWAALRTFQQVYPSHGVVMSEDRDYVVRYSIVAKCHVIAIRASDGEDCACVVVCVGQEEFPSALPIEVTRRALGIGDFP